ncbi:hypothetical protein ACFX15_035984 [Malus domestica]
MGLMSVKLHRVCREEEEEENRRCGGRKRVEEWITALDEPTEGKKGNSSENGAAPGGRVPSAVLPDGELHCSRSVTASGISGSGGFRKWTFWPEKLLLGLLVWELLI